VDWGADVIIGHHPHVIQEMEVYKNRPIFYSLGNFVFDQYFSAETQEGLAIKINFNSEKLSLSVWPLRSVKSQAQLMNKSAADNYLKSWLKNSRLGNNDFVNNTLSLDLAPNT
jgi:poly-gamma-glutamate synthesis protein (capsule biosynthesis protein)